MPSSSNNTVTGPLTKDDEQSDLQRRLQRVQENRDRLLGNEYRGHLEDSVHCLEEENIKDVQCPG